MLRQLLLSAILCMFLLPVSAQFSKGTRMIGATIASGFFSSGDATHRVTDIGSTSSKLNAYELKLSPSLGWFLSQNTAVGISFNLNPGGEKVTFQENGTTFQKDETRKFTISIGGFARNYFKSTGSFLPFGQFGFDLGITSQNAEGFFYGGTGGNVYREAYSSKSSAGFAANATLTLGVTKMMGSQTGLDLFIGYNYSNNKITMNTSTTRDEGNDGSIEETGTQETVSQLSNHRFIIGVGFQVFLSRAKK